jgi:hypothetical protein
MGLSRNHVKHHPGLVGSLVLVALTLPRGVDGKTFMCAAEDVSCVIQAINEANANGHARNTIRLAEGTYTLMNVDNQTDGSNGLPSITSTLKIEGASNETTTITRATGAPSFRLFHVAMGGYLTLQSVTLSNGAADGGGVFNNGGTVTVRGSAFTGNRGGSTGGGLFNVRGKVIVSRSTFTHNSGPFGGGGINNDGGDVTIRDSLFDSNGAGLEGGGLRNTSDGTIRIKRSLFSRNFGASGGGVDLISGMALVDETTFAGNGGDFIGGISVRAGATLIVTDSAFVENEVGLVSSGAGAISNSGAAAVTNTTFARNSKRRFASGGGGIAINNRGTLILTNSTFAENTGFSFDPVVASQENATTVLLNTILSHKPEALVQDCKGRVISLGHNLIGDPTGCDITLQLGDLIGDPGLDTFTDDGTPGNGHFPLLKDSQAVDAGNHAFCPRRDQIGQFRIGQCDIGAIEFQPKKHGHHRWNDNDDDEREGAWPRDLLDEGFDQPNGNSQTRQP